MFLYKNDQRENQGFLDTKLPFLAAHVAKGSSIRDFSASTRRLPICGPWPFESLDTLNVFSIEGKRKGFFEIEQ